MWDIAPEWCGIPGNAALLRPQRESRKDLTIASESMAASTRCGYAGDILGALPRDSQEERRVQGIRHCEAGSRYDQIEAQT
jgi:hypothetical protein